MHQGWVYTRKSNSDTHIHARGTSQQAQGATLKAFFANAFILASEKYKSFTWQSQPSDFRDTKVSYNLVQTILSLVKPSLDHNQGSYPAGNSPALKVMTYGCYFIEGHPTQSKGQLAWDWAKFLLCLSILPKHQALQGLKSIFRRATTTNAAAGYHQSRFKKRTPS